MPINHLRTLRFLPHPCHNSPRVLECGCTRGRTCLSSKDPTQAARGCSGFERSALSIAHMNRPFSRREKGWERSIGEATCSQSQHLPPRSCRRQSRKRCPQCRRHHRRTERNPQRDQTVSRRPLQAPSGLYLARPCHPHFSRNSRDSSAK